jgi:hypothetical protein
MKILEYITEASTPTGHIFLKFGNKPTGQKDRNGDPITYPVAWAGFGQNPSQVQFGNARLKFTKLHSPNDVADAVRTVLGDTDFGKVFISAKKLIVVPPSQSKDDAVSKFISWLQHNESDRLQLYMDDEVPVPKIDDKVTIKRPKKENPMLGKDIRKVDAADPKYTIHFTVNDRFYDAIRKNMPNLMKYKGSGQDFRMPKELFDKFRDAAQQRYGDVGIKVLKKAHTDEGIDEGGPADRALCRKAAKGKPIGASAKSSCISQGLLPHHSGRKDYVNGKQLPVDGKYIAGKKHGGPLPNYSKKKK